MKAIEFKEVNVHIVEDQPEYEVLPVHAEPDEESQRFFNRVTMCFELNKEERKQVAETGHIWHTILVPPSALFHPISMSFLKPEGFSEPPVKRLYFIYHNDRGFFVYKSKSQKKSRGELVGQFIGIPTQKTISEQQNEFEAGTVGALFNGERVEVIENLWFVR